MDDLLFHKNFGPNVNVNFSEHILQKIRKGARHRSGGPDSPVSPGGPWVQYINRYIYIITYAKKSENTNIASYGRPQKGTRNIRPQTSYGFARRFFMLKC